MSARLLPIFFVSLLAVLAPGLAAQLQTQKLVTSANGGDHLGWCAAIDGDWAVVGAPGDAADRGAVHLFERVGASWTIRTNLTGPIGQSARFGHDVSLCGSTLVVGALSASFAGADSGAAFVYERQGTFWLQTAVLIASDAAAGDNFGSSVVIDGDTVLVGSPDNFSNAFRAGAAYFFECQAGTWAETQKIQAPDGADLDMFGSAIDLSGDAAILGAQYNGEVAPFAGAAYVFERGGGGWALATKLLPFPSSVGFGYSVAIEGDMALAWTGFMGLQDASNLVHRQGVTGWAREDELFTANGYLTNRELALSGGVALVSATPTLAAPGGRAVMFRQDASGSWAEIAELGSSDSGSNDNFGLGFAIDGIRAIVGAPFHDPASGPDTGAAYAFALCGLATSYCTGKVNSDGCTPYLSANGIASMSSPAQFGIDCFDVPAQRMGVLFYGLGGRATIPWIQSTLCVSPPVRRTQTQGSNGFAPCSGQYFLDFNGWAQSGMDPNLTPGQQINMQCWYEDPDHVDGTNAGGSDALEFVLCP